jgi:hypothetical protein
VLESSILIIRLILGEEGEGLHVGSQMDLVSVFVRGCCCKNALRRKSSLVLVVFRFLQKPRRLLGQTLSHVALLVIKEQGRSGFYVSVIGNIFDNFHYWLSIIKFLVKKLQILVFFLGIGSRVLILGFAWVRPIVIAVIRSLFDTV